MRFLRKLYEQNRITHVLLVDLLKEVYRMKSAISQLEEAVEQQTTVVESVSTLLTDLVQRFRDAEGDTAKINKLVDQLEANSEKLAAAAVANTESEEAEGGEEASDPA